MLTWNISTEIFAYLVTQPRWIGRYTKDICKKLIIVGILANLHFSVVKPIGDWYMYFTEMES